MSWISLTEDDVVARLSGPELSAYRTAALKTGQTDPLTNILAQTIDEVRGYIAACRNNQLGDGETVPSKLVSATVAMIRYRLITRLPINGASLLQTREKEYTDAVALMRDVAACRFAVEEPSTISTEVISGPSPSYSARSRRFTRDQEDGA